MERLDHIEEKIDRIENKIDKFIETSSKNSTDIAWLKGAIKVNFSILTTIITGVAGWVIRIVMSK